jgi:hypothetical protein
MRTVVHATNAARSVARHKWSIGVLRQAGVCTHTARRVMRVSSFSAGIDLRELRRALAKRAPGALCPFSPGASHPKFMGSCEPAIKRPVRGAMVKYVVIGFLLIFIPGLLVGWLWLLFH